MRNLKDDSTDSTFASLALFAFFVAGAAYVFWVGPSVLWYAVEYKVSPKKIQIDSKPADCDFWHAPVGFKGCHYERSVVALRCDKPDDEGFAICRADDRNVNHDHVSVKWFKKSD
jgi:hypothetical protein